MGLRQPLLERARSHGGAARAAGPGRLTYRAPGKPVLSPVRHWVGCSTARGTTSDFRVALCVWGIRPKLAPSAQEESVLESIRVGCRYVFSQQALWTSMALDLFAVLFSGAILRRLHGGAPPDPAAALAISHARVVAFVAQAGFLLHGLNLEAHPRPDAGVTPLSLNAAEGPSV